MRSFIFTLALGCFLESLVLASARWFDKVLASFAKLPAVGEIESVYPALIVTWADGTYDTTMGYRYFGPQTFLFALMFACAGYGAWKRRAWGYSLLMLLASIGLLEPIARLVTLRFLVRDSDTLGYVLDVRQSQVAIVCASQPSAIAIFALMLPKVRLAFGKHPGDWRQFTISSVATATFVFAILLTHVLSLSQVYGPFFRVAF